MSGVGSKNSQMSYYYSLVPPSRGQANEGHCNWILKHTFLNDEPFVSLIFLPRTFDANLHLLLLPLAVLLMIFRNCITF